MEIDLPAGFHSPADVDDVVEQIAKAFHKLVAPRRAIIFSDWRACRLFAPETAERLVSGLGRVNAKIERSAILHNPDQATSVLQVARVIREGGHAHRRVFTKAKDVVAFLSDVLDKAELERLQFLIARR